MTRFIVPLIALLALLSAAPLLRAQDADAESLGKRLEQYGKLEERITSLFEKKQYDKASDICKEQMILLPESAEPHYNMACAMARLGKKDEALIELGQAVDLGFTDTIHMKQDDDLASLHDEDKFKDLLKSARDKELSAPREFPAEIDGVKSIENFPEGGLRYRLRISPKADAKHPARLVIWLHPSGSSMDNIVEELAPKLADDGFAMLVFTQKNYNFWSNGDASALLDQTLPDVAKIEGVDAKKPVLLGFSAGGQLALDLWQKNPSAFGGVILDAAYPIDTQKFASGKVEPMTLPKNDAVKTCPIMVVVGGSDGGSRYWQMAQQTWQNANIPLTVHIIPDKGHEWLFDTVSERFWLNDWLKRVAAGELPNQLANPNEHEDASPQKVLFVR